MKLQELIAKVLGVEKHLAESDQKISALESESAKHKATASELETSLSSLQAEFEKVSTEKAALETQAAESAEKIASLESENTEMKGKLEDPESTIQQEASKKAQTVLASTGTPPVEEVNENGEASGKSILEQYQALTDPASQQEFFRKNAQELLKAQSRAAG